MVSNVKIVQKTVITFNNKILVVRRSPADEIRANCWDFPGGNVDDEDVEKFNKNILINSLVREVKEEVGIDINGNDVKMIYINDGWKNDKGGLFIGIAYKVNIDVKQKIKISSEHTEYKWVDRDELQYLDFGISDLFERVIKILSKEI